MDKVAKKARCRVRHGKFNLDLCDPAGIGMSWSVRIIITQGMLKRLFGAKEVRCGSAMPWPWVDYDFVYSDEEGAE